MTSKTATPKVPVPVALPKKDDESANSATATATATSSPHLLGPEEALNTAIGSKLRITLVPPFSDQPYEGYLHTADADFNWLLLWNHTSSTPSSTTPHPHTPLPPNGTIKVLMFSQIQSFQILSLPTPSDPLTNPNLTPITTTIDTHQGQLRLEKAIRTEQEILSRKGPKGTSPSEQALFEALARTMPARWEGSRMVISDHYVIDKPYAAVNVGMGDEEKGKGGGGGGGKGSQGLERIKRIVEMERTKIMLRLGSGEGKGAGRKGG